MIILIEFTHSKFSICSCVGGMVSMATSCIIDIYIRTHTFKQLYDSSSSINSSSNVVAECDSVCALVVRWCFFPPPCFTHSSNSIRAKYVFFRPVNWESIVNLYVACEKSMWMLCKYSYGDFHNNFTHVWNVCVCKRVCLYAYILLKSSSSSASFTSSIVYFIHTYVWHMRIHISVCWVCMCMNWRIQ